MKGGIAAFVAAAKRYLEAEQLNGSLSLIITGDEEAEAVNGTVKMVDWMTETDNVPDFCMVGEQQTPLYGTDHQEWTRGSLSCELTVTGRQGHVAYPHLANNPIPALFSMLAPVNSTELDNGTAYFGPGTAEVTGLKIRDPASNVIPDQVTAQFNIRFNTEHTVDSLQLWLDEHFGRLAEKLQVSYEAQFWSNASPFITEFSDHLNIVRETVKQVTGQQRLINNRRHVRCPVHRKNLSGSGIWFDCQTMHQVDEHVRLADIETLTEIYFQMIRQMDS